MFGKVGRTDKNSYQGVKAILIAEANEFMVTFICISEKSARKREDEIR